MITGVTGMLIGDLVLGCLKAKSSFAQGASLGNAAHGLVPVKHICVIKMKVLSQV